MAKYTGAKRAVVCVSGTNALHMSLLLAGVKKDDEVLTQALTFIATCNALSYIGAHPVFLDVDKSTMGLSPDAMKEWLQANAEIRKNTRIAELPESQDFAFREDELACYNKHTGCRIKACVPMHTFGHAVRIEEIVALCKEWHIELVEDAAESIGSTYKGQHTGTFGRIGAISFNGNKMITTSGGGALLCHTEEEARRVKFYATQAREPFPWYQHEQIGYNYRLSNVSAGIGRGQMRVVDNHIARRRSIHRLYTELLAGLPGITVVEPKKSTMFLPNYWLTTIKVDSNETGFSALQLMQHLAKADIETRPLWKPLHLQPVFSSSPSYVNGISEALFNCGLCLPSGPMVTDGDVMRVADAIRSMIESIK